MSLYCSGCKKTVFSEVEMKQHLSSKGHLKAHKSQNEQQSTIFVSGFYIETEEDVLRNYFAQFGRIKKLKLLGKNNASQRPFAFITYENPSDLECVLNSVHILDQTRLRVSRKLFTPVNELGKSKEDLNMKVREELQRGNSIEKSIEKLCEILSLSKAEIKERLEIAKTITDLLKPYYPECEVQIYGSSMNGFGFKNSDVDLLFLPTSHYCNSNDTSSDCELTVVPTPSDLERGITSISQLSLLDEHSHLAFIQKLFYRNRSLFARPLLIPAKCPIINFIYVKREKLLCDLSCSNRLVLYNTELLNMYGVMDRRVKLLLMTIRYWGKQHNFIKIRDFSSYAFSLLVIFFLQNVEPPIIPSVEHLRQHSVSQSVGGWECGFSKNCDTFKSENTQSIEELFWGFFKYYLQFNFFESIICPASGKVFPIKDLQALDDPRVKNFKVTSICVQDIFELCRNVSGNVKHQTLIALKTTMNSILRMQSNTSLHNLLPIFEPVTCEITKLQSEIKCVACTIDYSSSCHLHFTQLINQSEERQKMWYIKASQAVLEVLREGLLLECEVFDKIQDFGNVSNQTLAVSLEDGQSKGTKPSDFGSEVDFANENYDLELLLSIQCGIYFRTWDKRFSISQILKSEGKNTLDVEREISLYIIDNKPKNNSEPQCWFMCDCFRYTKLNIMDILVLFTPLSSSKEFSSITTFLKSYLPRTVSKVLTETQFDNNSIEIH